MAEKKTTTIKQVVFIPAEPEEVFETFVNGKTHAAFTGAKASSDPKVGGKFTAWDGYIFGKFLKLEKGKRIVQEWKTTEWPEDYPPSIVELNLKKKDGGTELTMVHLKVPAEQADSYRQGWIDFYWTPLKRYFSGRQK